MGFGSNILVKVEKKGWLYGTLKREIWCGLAGVTLNEFVSNGRFKKAADEVERLDSAEFHSNQS